jgi:tRNA-dependent cyclodipeptide synthase
MKLHLIRGGSREDLENRKYNIGVGISLGNKWFTPENILGLIKWSSRYTKENVVVYVADTIHAINVEVRKRKSYEVALKHVVKEGTAILDCVKQISNKSLSPEALNRISFATWSDIVDERYRQKVIFLYSFFEKNIVFRKKLISLVKSHLKKEKRSFSEKEIIRLSHYIIEELPEVLNRVKINNVIYDAYAYPFDGELPIFVEQIQRGEVFPEIKTAIIDTEPKVFLEVR